MFTQVKTAVFPLLKKCPIIEIVIIITEYTYTKHAITNNLISSKFFSCFYQNGKAALEK